MLNLTNFEIFRYFNEINYSTIQVFFLITVLEIMLQQAW